MIIKLKNIGTIITGNTPSKKNAKYYDSNDIYFIKPDTLDDSKITVLNSSNEFISNNARDKARIVGKNAILITCIGSIGKVGIVTEGEYAFNQQINAIIPNELVIPKYLAYCLLFNKDKLIDIANAPVVPIINKSQFGEFEIIINEDLYVQQKIVNELNIIQEIILKQRQELEKMNDLIKARFVEMFGDPIDNPREYPVHQLSEYIMSLTSGSRGWAQYCVDDGEEWFITIKNVNNCHISIDNMQPVNAPDNAEAKRTKVHEGDLLISITADLGRTGVVTKEIAEHGAYINQHLSCIRLNRDALNPLFVAHYMESSAGKEQFIAKNQSAVKAGLNFNSINSLKIMVPPLAEQNRFIDFIKHVDKSKLAVQQSLEKTQQLFDSLMQEYFG